MPIHYTNRRNQTYYLHQSKTKTGKPNYFFSLSSEGVLPDRMPAGYEIYENPRAQVFLRKKQPKVILDAEIATVENRMKQYSDVEYYLIEAKKNAIYVYLADQDVNALKDLLSVPFARKFEDMGKTLDGMLDYSPMMRFVLTDEDRRKFIVERYCFLGSVDDWIVISEPGEIEHLTKRYLKHLGKDSYFELF